MVAPRKDPKSCVRGVPFDVGCPAGPGHSPSACTRIAEQLGVNSETLRSRVMHA